MKRLLLALCLAGAGALPQTANASWITGAIQEIRVMVQGTGNDMIVVFLSGTTGCTYNAFLLTPADTFLKETYALLLTARATGKTIRYDHQYCHSTGYSRGNQYEIVN